MTHSRLFKSVTALLCTAAIVTSLFALQFSVSAQAPVAPTVPSNIVKELNMDVAYKESLAAFNNINWSVFASEDDSAATSIEIDMYVADRNAFATGNNGNIVGIYLHLYSGDANTMKEIGIHDYVTKDGWNHAKIEIPAEVDMTKFRGFEIGPWDSFAGEFAVANVCLTADSITAPAAPENVVKELDMSLTVKDSLNAYQDITSNRYAAEDSSKATFFEVDLYVDNFEAFKVANGGNMVGIYLHLYSGDADTMKEVGIHDTINKDGWNHIKLSLPSDVDMTKFRGFVIGPWNGYSGTFAVANVCLTKEAAVVAPSAPENIVKELKMDAVIVDKLVAYNNFNWAVFEAEDISDAQYLEMDLYVADYAAFSTAKNGNEKAGVFTNILHGTDAKECVGVHDYITAEGWNHVKVLIPSGVDLTTIRGFENGPWESFNGTFGVANVCLTKDAVVIPKPDMPENVGLLIDEKGFSYNAWNGELCFAKVEDWVGNQIDITKNAYFECDIYISEEDFATYGADPKNIGFWLGTSDEFWQQRAIYQGKLKPTQAGWNHFKIKIEESSYWEGDVDFTHLSRVAFYHEGMEGRTETVRFANICLTLAPKEPDGDEDKPSKPDTNAYYLTDCESLVGNGTWNPDSVALDTFNKTEGSSSVMNIFKDGTVRSNSMRYTSNTKLDLSKATALKFDFFISNEMIKDKATLDIRLTSDGRGFDNYLATAVSMADLQVGWNSFEISIADMVKTGTVDMANIDTFGVYATSVSFEELDEVKVKIDNVRISGTVKEVASSNIDDDIFDNLIDGIKDILTGDNSAALAVLALALVSAAACGIIVYKKKQKVQ